MPSPDDKSDQQKEAEKIAKKHERELIAAVLAALFFLQTRVNLYAVLLYHGDIWDEFNAEIGQSISPVFDAYDQSARTLWKPFDSLSPEVIQEQRDYKSAFVREFGAGTRDAVNAVFAWGSQNNLSQTDVAKMLAMTAGTNQRQTGAMLVMWKMLQDTGASPGIMDKMLRKSADKYLKDRAKTTAGTELWRAVNMGREAAAKQAERMSNEEVVGVKTWVTSEDERTCPRCFALHGEEQPIGEMFSAGVMMPGLHCSCRCWVEINLND